MSSQPSPPPPDPPNLSPKGKWGVAPSTSPQVARPGRRSNHAPLPWWILAALVVVVVALAIVLIF
ncbi:hypothetical protein PJK45_02305 [Mycobacterium kansasii]|uniref:Uncharacterized protein n=1 Tax=Mycobacterium kansasii TaxID=1768 RepID=A0A1V3WMK1_MYCKA|nr:hypothetical protein [Mycobacterium kansasii]EUA00698.1 hypothetical protein I547_4767 [Mycobacterium kansasii 824]KEP41265.1 hypothetical protein MKSMC1_36860 [Mycobacterium kansasii]MXO36226.1 hypothetical protein [Mycobacterium kansasii]OOK68203.1 hypothetical protein BZL29_6776 [Mycobacterium kansasii]OOK71818.1 hypothetical protein BZL30_5712 [Mycobacterium kansasii]